MFPRENFYHSEKTNFVRLPTSRTTPYSGFRNVTRSGTDCTEEGNHGQTVLKKVREGDEIGEKGGTIRNL